MAHTPSERTQWEYVGIQSASTNAAGFIRSLNDAGARGWELISIAGNDRTVGINAIFGILRRPIEPLPDPEDRTEDWKPDPSGRYEIRWWDGEAWTMRTRTAGIEHRDPPTRRTPAELPQ